MKITASLYSFENQPKINFLNEPILFQDLELRDPAIKKQIYQLCPGAVLKYTRSVSILGYWLGGLVNIFIFAAIIFNPPLANFGGENHGPEVQCPTTLFRVGH